MSRAPQSPPASAARDFELYDELMPVRRYKLLLQAFLKRRGPGTRQAIAEALGNSRGFVTQLTSPAYDLAISPQYLRAIIRQAGLTAQEERIFLDAYLAAHPDRAAEVLGRADDAAGMQSVTVTVPRLASPAAQHRLQALIERFAKDVGEAMREQEAELGAAPQREDAA